MRSEDKKQHKLMLWIWVLTSIFLLTWLGYDLYEAEDKTVFMPGPLTDGHHQIGLACESCHGESFSDAESMQKKCVECHGEDRKKPFDSHPRNKFTDPRNASKLENINATLCITCHTEHVPDMADKNGLTQPGDFCVFCHEDIADDRPSHKGMPFSSCNDAGCHNFHNNRALYTDYLVKHIGQPDILEKPRVPEKDFAKVLAEIVEYPAQDYPVKQLKSSDADAPENVSLNDAEHMDWLATAHARSGVNCTACHVDKSDKKAEPKWVNNPGQAVCSQCHAVETDRFKRGKHGMRLQVELPPMQVADARLPMKQKAAHETLTCMSCHGAHKFDVQEAAVDSCVACHDDKHTLAYKDSPHAELWHKEKTGQAEPGTGVSCSTCHMPRINYDVSDWMSRTIVDHNQNATLSPNEKMIRPVCIHCHGLEFTLDSLADESLIENNFKGRSGIHVRSMGLAEADQKRAEQERKSAR